MRRLFVLDASTTLAWCFGDEQNSIALEALSALRLGAAVVPPIWTHEVSNALITAERRGRISWSVAEQFLSALGKLPIEVDTATATRISATVLMPARECSLSYYDATYLELAARLGLPLATIDTGLMRAMQQMNVPAWRLQCDMAQEEETSYGQAPSLYTPVY